MWEIDFRSPFRGPPSSCVGVLFAAVVVVSRSRFKRGTEVAMIGASAAFISLAKMSGLHVQQSSSPAASAAIAAAGCPAFRG
jgi:hypothetical protein